MAQGLPTCPHVKVGLSLDELFRIYKRKSAEHCKTDTFICLKCGHKRPKSLLSEHATHRHAHKIAICLKTMEAWCFKCMKVPTDNSGTLSDIISQLNELSYFRKRLKLSAPSTQPPNKSNAATKQITSQSVKPNATIRSLQVVGSKSCKVPSSVNKSSGFYASGVIGSVGTTQYIPKSKQQCNYKQRQQYCKPTEDNSTKVVAKQSVVHKSPHKLHTNISTTTNHNAMSSNTTVGSGLNLRGTASKWKPPMQRTNISTTKNTSLNSCGTMKTSKSTISNYRSKPSTNVSATKNLSTVLLSNNSASSNAKGTTSNFKSSTNASMAKTPSTVLLSNNSGIIGKGSNLSVPNNGGPTQHHLKVHRNSLKNVKERKETPKSVGHANKDNIMQTETHVTHKSKVKKSANEESRGIVRKKPLPFTAAKKSTVAIPKSVSYQGVRLDHQQSLNDSATADRENKHPYVDQRKKQNGYDVNDNVSEVLRTGKMLPDYRPIVGLQNVGNTCFFNSVLQVVYQSRYLRYYINRAKIYPCKSELDGPEGLVEFEITEPLGQLTSALNRFLNEAESQAKVQNPAFLLNILATRYKRFRGFDQQDSHEAFRCLLDGLKMEEIKRVQESICSKLTGNPSVKAKYEKLARKSRTFVDETFGGILSSTVICRDCFTPVQLKEPFFDLSLSISGLRNRKYINSEVGNPYTIREFLRKRNLHHQLKEYKENDNYNTLEACLRCYTTLEVLDDENKFICSMCTNNKVNGSLASQSLDGVALCPVSKLLLLHKLPKILVLHLKRFKLGATVTKNNCHIDFPFELDMASYCTDNCEEYMKNNKIMYSLYGVVVHHGSLHGGHYTAYVKAAGTHGITAMWYYASDSHVRSARVEEISKCNAYMLFYESTFTI